MAVITAIIGGLFSLLGIWLKHNLEQRVDSEPSTTNIPVSSRTEEVRRRRLPSLGWDFAVTWILTSLAGGGAGLAAFTYLEGGILGGAGAGLAIGLAQWLVLRAYFVDSGWWVFVATGLTLLCAAAVSGGSDEFAGPLMFILVYLAFVIISVVVVPLVFRRSAQHRSQT